MLARRSERPRGCLLVYTSGWLAGAQFVVVPGSISLSVCLALILFRVLFGLSECFVCSSVSILMSVSNFLCLSGISVLLAVCLSVCLLAVWFAGTLYCRAGTRCSGLRDRY